MRNFTEQEISFLVNNGFLMHSVYKFDRDWLLYPGKPEKMKRKAHTVLQSSNLPLGYPILVTKEKLNGRYSKFPINLLKPYPFISNGKDVDLYLIPNGLIEIEHFPDNNNELTSKLNEWSNLADIYITENTVMEKFSQTEMDLIKLFRELYLLYLKSTINLFNPISKEFFKLYKEGQEYRSNLSKNFKKVYSSLANNQKFNELMVNILEKTEDIILFEEEILKQHGNFYWGGKHSFCGIDFTFADLWHGISKEKYKNNLCTEISPFLKRFRSKLYDYQEKTRSAIEVNKILSWMEIYDFSIIKEDYLHFFNNSPKKDVIQFTEKKLKEKDALPKVSTQLLIQEDIKTVYTNTLTMNFNFIKEKIANHVLGAETLIAITTKSFREDEKECTFISYEISFNDGIVKFLIESLDMIATKELSEKLLTYLNSAISSGFLTVDMIKELIRHGNSLDRKKHENDKKIMAQYIMINRPALLKNELGKELGTNAGKKKVNKL